MYKKPGNPAVEELNKSCKDRSINLTRLQTIKLPELNEKGNPRKLCKWCAKVEVFGNRQYCDEDCNNSAMAWAYPQKENSLKFLLERQEWKCLICLYDYSPFLQKIIERDRNLSKKPKFEDLFWYHFKRLKHIVPSDKKPEVDHNIPVAKGGQSIGLENLNCLCFSCHKEKTKIDNSGPRSKK